MSTIVFWHGWGMGPGVWEDLANCLRPALANRHKLLIQPLPGYTPNQEPIIHYSAATLLDDLMAKLTPPLILCGWSLGAMLAMLAAVRFPDQVEKLILVGATPNFMERPDWPDGVSPALIDKLGSGIRVNPAAALRRFITIFNQHDDHAREIARKLTNITSAPPPCLETGLDILKYTDLRPIVHEIQQPVLLLHGAQDTLMPLSSAEWLHKNMQNARLAVLPGASHAPFLSDPAASTSFITDFLDASRC
ncbi:MAG: alpha/beta fold hydrolase [Alistipes senegalensis]|nr:alpha/beta fold hydrolase [Oxalobacter formigenes]MCM1281145.1 alpha/beta fold hydrolase [Alistipes senegalensis]